MRVEMKQKQKLVKPGYSDGQSVSHGVRRMLCNRGKFVRLVQCLSLGLSIVVAAQAVIAQGNFATAGSCAGGSSGCGGNTITVNGKQIPIGTYLAERKLKGKKLEEFKARVKENFAELRARGLHEFADLLEAGFDDYSWYMVQEPLEKLGYGDTKIPFKSNQTIRQDKGHVIIHEQGFKEIPSGLDRVAIYQELLERVLQSGKNINSSISSLNLAAAADLLGRGKLSQEKELRAELKKLGFETENLIPISVGASKKTINANRLELPVDLAAPITLSAAREKLYYCASVDQNRSIIRQIQRQFAPEFNGVSFSTRKRYYGVRAELSEDLLDTHSEFNIVDTNNFTGDCKSNSDLTKPKCVLSMHYIGGNKGVYAHKMLEEATSENKKEKVFFENLSAVYKRDRIVGFESQGVEGDPVYSRWGTVNLDRRLAEIKLIVDKPTWQGNGLVQLYASDSEIVIPLQINLHDYVGCIRDELAKASVEAANSKDGANGEIVRKAKSSPDAAQPSGDKKQNQKEAK